MYSHDLYSVERVHFCLAECSSTENKKEEKTKLTTQSPITLNESHFVTLLMQSSRRIRSTATTSNHSNIDRQIAKLPHRRKRRRRRRSRICQSRRHAQRHKESVGEHGREL